MDDLVERVNAGIGATRANRSQRPVGEAAESRLELVLNGLASRLTLPTTIGAPSIADAKRHSHEGARDGGIASRISPEIGEHALCPALHGPAGFGHDFVQQVARSVGVADLPEFLGQFELAGQGVVR